MKLTTLAAGTILVLGLSTTVYAETAKCGGSNMQKQSSKCGANINLNMAFKDKKAMCLSKIDTMQKCVNAATTSEELQACKTDMMTRGQGSKMMMKNSGGMTGRMMPTFSDFDNNADGKVTQAEFENTQQMRMTENAEAGKMMRNAGNAPMFSDIDTNKDGYIDQAEFQMHQASERKGGARGMGTQNMMDADKVLPTRPGKCG